MSRVVEANEPGTTDYQFYLNETEIKCLVHETYVNSDAVLAHNAGVASKPKILSISRISRFDVYGHPGEELLTSFHPQTFNLFTGFTR